MSQAPDFDLRTGRVFIGPVASSGLLAAIIFLLAVYALGFSKKSNSGNLPFVNPPIPFDFGNRRRLKDFTQNSLEILKTGRAMYPNEPYLIFSELGHETVVLPTHMINEVKRHPAMGFSEGAGEVIVPQASQRLSPFWYGYDTNH